MVRLAVVIVSVLVAFVASYWACEQIYGTWVRDIQRDRDFQNKVVMGAIALSMPILFFWGFYLDRIKRS